MAGHKKLSGKQEEIRFTVSLCLCKYVNPETGSITNRLEAYVQVVQELGQLDVSPRYVGDIWQRHKDAIVDSLRHDLKESLKHKKVPGRPRRITIEELHARVRMCRSCSWRTRIGKDRAIVRSIVILLF
jgi:hypothetical protein